jgi:sodium/potassium-transporting ATPase subunit alpha
MGLGEDKDKELWRARSPTQSSVDTLAVAVETPPAPQLAVAYRTLSCEDRVFLRTLDELDKKVSIEQESIHRLGANFAIERLKSHPYLGLSDKEASRRLKEFGLNAISPPKVNLWLKYGSYFFGGFCWILWIASLAVFLSWSNMRLNDALGSKSNSIKCT